jgi:hypothetical protein
MLPLTAYLLHCWCIHGIRIPPLSSRSRCAQLPGCCRTLAHTHFPPDCLPASLLNSSTCLAVCSLSRMRVGSSGWWACTASHSTRSSHAAVQQRSRSAGASSCKGLGPHLPHTSPNTPHMAAQQLLQLVLVAVNVLAICIVARHQHLQQQSSMRREMQPGPAVAVAGAVVVVWGGRVRCSS